MLQFSKMGRGLKHYENTEVNLIYFIAQILLWGWWIYRLGRCYFG